MTRNKFVWRNTENSFGLVAIILHWLVTLLMVWMLGFGFWLLALDYADPAYDQVRLLHLSGGILLLLTALTQSLWRLISPPPQPVPETTGFQRNLAAFFHSLLNATLFFLLISGYLNAATIMQSISFFGLFDLPLASIQNALRIQYVVGKIHLFLAFLMIALVAIHALAAAKHHLIARNQVLTRMLPGRRGATLENGQPGA